MRVLFSIVVDEWRYWKRSKIAITLLVLGVLLAIASSVINGVKIYDVSHERAHLQEAADTRFIQQPNRHPHRMVHYGHYVFRTPTPLSYLDPGIDAFTGHTIFLEGHRQNSAMFAEQRQMGGLARFSRLTPSFILQTVAPLFIVLMGYASITREKEAGTLIVILTQGVTFRTLVLGKALALISVCVVLLLPFLIASIWVVIFGENLLVTLSFFAGYAFYLFVWVCITVCFSVMLLQSHTSLIGLVTLWVVFCILSPRLASNTAAFLAPSESKLTLDFEVRNALAKLGDGHSAADPAFVTLKANLLAKYKVDSIEELPVNFRGVVAQYAEAQLTQVLIQFAEERMKQELMQANVAREFGWLSPTVALRTYSMLLSGSSLETHHKFLREAEEVRFEFVQSLNELHEKALDYQADLNRNKNSTAQQNARISDQHWKNAFSEFSFEPYSAKHRLESNKYYAAQLILWGLISIFGVFYVTRKERI